LENKADNNLLDQTFFSRIAHKLYPGILPLLFGIYPILQYFSNNAKIVLFSSFIRIALLQTGIILILYGLFLVINKSKAILAANSTCVILLFFNTYGIIYNYLLELDIVRIEHYTLLPLYLLISFYLSWAITKLNEQISFIVWKILTMVLCSFTIVSLFQIIPIEINKNKDIDKQIVVNNDDDQDKLSKTFPDIYYIVFDEFSGFQPMREYWGNTKVDELKDFLVSKGFFVAEHSYGSSIDTLHQMATRLNYKEYPFEPGQADVWFDAIANNRVMSMVKAKGYTTIVFNEIPFGYPTAPPIISDYTFISDQISSVDIGIIFDEFGMMVADKTMLCVFSKYYKLSSPTFLNHRNMILFTASKITALEGIPSPKLVYSHLLFPHFPFMFDENGGFIDPQYYYDWNYYEGNYNYAIRIIEKIVAGIQANENLENPPIIILQSDHGARNKKTGDPNSKILQNFPEDYKTNILFALSLPGYDVSQLEQNIDPINTFPIIFNYYFDENIPLK